MVGRDDPMQDALLVADEEMMEVNDGAGNDGRRPSIFNRLSNFCPALKYKSIVEYSLSLR